MKLATPKAFAADPESVHAFYNLRRRDLLRSQPNAAHAALARLARELAARDERLWLCTQNIDDLHERTGSVDVHHTSRQTTPRPSASALAARRLGRQTQP